MFSIFKPYIFSLDPEIAHDLAIKSLKFNILPKSIFKVEDEEILETTFLKKASPRLLGDNGAPAQMGKDAPCRHRRSPGL